MSSGPRVTRCLRLQAGRAGLRSESGWVASDHATRVLSHSDRLMSQSGSDVDRLEIVRSTAAGIRNELANFSPSNDARRAADANTSPLSKGGNRGVFCWLGRPRSTPLHPPFERGDEEERHCLGMLPHAEDFTL